MSKLKNAMLFAMGLQAAPKNINLQNNRPNKVYSTVVQTQARRTRYDIENWRRALKSAESIDNPNPVALYDIYFDALLDALLTSQLENRTLQLIGTPYEIQLENGEPDEESTSKLSSDLWFPEFQKEYSDTKWWGHSLFEFGTNNGVLYFDLIPRKNVRAKEGIVLKRQSDINGTNYRDLREFGSWLIEAGSITSVGLLNRAVPHVLMKRFAQSCWSEFCEIYGMPTRVLKTNTSDPTMLSRAKEMMQQWGSNAWAIIDESELVEFVEAMNGTGQVYSSLITLCNSEISLLASGAIIGQDTVHGTRGKEQVSADMLADLVRADRTDFENYANSTLLPALYKIGYMPAGRKFRFKPLEDLDSLWSKTKDALPYYNIDKAWVHDKFGIPLEDKNTFGVESLNAKNGDAPFFG